MKNGWTAALHPSTHPLFHSSPLLSLVPSVQIFFWCFVEGQGNPIGAVSSRAIRTALKIALFLPNSFKMDLDVERFEGWTGFDFVPAIRSKIQLILCVGLLVIFRTDAPAQSRSDSPADFAKYAMKLPEKSLLRIEPQITRSPTNRLTGSGLSDGSGSLVSERNSLGAGLGAYDWKVGITTTIFWVGEQASANNPVSNDKSAWDSGWVSSFGGCDTPVLEDRLNFVPANFTPRQNPFYVALPYNDVDNHHTKPEAGQVIPWFKSSFVRDGQSVCKGRWVAIRHGKKVCYAQWEDVGPFQTDHWQYVFGSERPRPNKNRDAGIDLSPAVRDYLALENIDSCDWKFVDFLSVPIGPWAIYGDNNTFNRIHRAKASSIAASHRTPQAY